MNFYKRYPADYLSDTRHLTLAEHGAYTLLLDFYYFNEKQIPSDEVEVARLLCLKSQKEKQTLQRILKEFFIKTRQGWRHKRCEAELSVYREYVKRSKENGLKGGRPKTKTEPRGFSKITKTERVLGDNQNQNQNQTAVPVDRGHTPSTTTPLPPVGTGGEEVFEWARETIAVQLGRRRRIPNLSAYVGARAYEVVQFLNRKGFPARIVVVQ